MAQKYTTTSIRLPSEVHHWLSGEAERGYRSINAMIGLLLHTAMTASVGGGGVGGGGGGGGDGLVGGEWCGQAVPPSPDGKSRQINIRLDEDSARYLDYLSLHGVRKTHYMTKLLRDDMRMRLARGDKGLAGFQANV